MADHLKKTLLNKINAAIRAAENHQHEHAYNIYCQYLQDLPDDRKITIRYGVLCNLLGEHRTAIERLSMYLGKNPEDPAILDLLGDLLLGDKQYQEADKQLRKLITISPREWKPLLNLGVANLNLENYDEAISFLEKARILKPSLPEIYINLSYCMMRTNRPALALEYGKKAVALAPNNYDANNSLGLILSITGSMSEGIKYIEKAIRLDMYNPLAYKNLTIMKRFTPADMAMAKNLEKVLERSMPASERSGFCYVLGRIYDDCKEWDKAFYYVKQANQLASTTRQENPASPKVLKSLTKTYNKKLFEKYRNIGNQSEIPVFIVGMPRSGSSLVEQIISSHPEAEGAGEIPEMGWLLRDIRATENPATYQAQVKAMLAEHKINEISNAYLTKLRQNRETARRIVDKYIENYFYLGLINLLFPNAKIIHIRRSPLDTCISCYFQYFEAHTVGWSFDPVWITNTYHIYRQAMDFWESVLPANKILSVQYEQLIEEPEKHIRKIIEHCNLDWDAACLEFYNASNMVMTVSMNQVRQPIYKNAVQRWKNYGKNVGVFAQGLIEYLDESDKEYLAGLGIKLKPKKWWKLLA